MTDTQPAANTADSIARLGPIWLNAGVIGLPANDGSTDGWYMLLEPVKNGFVASWHRLLYEAGLSYASTFAVGMSEYALALTSGLWPSMDILPAHERGNQGQRLELDSLRIESKS